MTQTILRGCACWDVALLVATLTLCLQVASKCVLWQTVKTPMKCRIIGHFIRISLFAIETTIISERNIFFSEFITYDPSIYEMDHLKCIVSNQKE